MTVDKNPFEDLDDEEFEYLEDSAKNKKEQTSSTYDDIQDAWDKQSASWKKGQYVVLSDSYANREMGYDGLVGQIVEDDAHASHIGYTIVKIINKGKWKDKVITIEVADIKKTAEKDIVKHLVLDAL